MLRSRSFKTLTISLVLLPLVLTGCGMPPADEPVTHGTADVEEIDILIMESFPVQVAVVARGHLRDSCTEIDEIRRTFDTETKTFFVEITTIRPADAVCAQVLEPFEERVTLDVDGLPAGTYTADVNDVTDTFTLDVDNVLPETPITEISWDQARELILSGDVEQATQLHSRQVTLHLEDGRQLVTMEPQLDAVFDVIDECGEPCADMVLATE